MILKHSLIKLGPHPPTAYICQFLPLKIGLRYQPTEHVFVPAYTGQVEGSTNETHRLVGVYGAIPDGGFSFVLRVEGRFVFPFLF